MFLIVLTVREVSGWRVGAGVAAAISDPAAVPPLTDAYARGLFNIPVCKPGSCPLRHFDVVCSWCSRNLRPGTGNSSDIEGSNVERTNSITRAQLIILSDFSPLPAPVAATAVLIDFL